MTKTFTALLLAEAVERGEVTLEQPVQSLLPDYTIPRFGERTITLLDLATQSSGLPRLPENLLPKDATNPYADYTVERLKQFLAGYRLPRAPGASYEYSNLGFGLLGQALAQRADTSYQDLLRDRVTGPLSLRSTAIALTPGMKSHFVRGHDANGKPAPAWDLGALEGAGAVRSTASDLLTWVERHMHPEGPLSKALSAVVQRRRPTADGDVGIGLAWQVATWQGRPFLWHDGATGGYAAWVGFTAAGDRGVVVLTNVSGDLSEIARAALLGADITSLSAPQQVSLAPEVLVGYVGRYRLAPGFELAVRLAGGELQVQATGQPSLPVFASAPEEFYYKVVDARLSFHRDEAGKVDSVVLHQNGRDMLAPRIASEAAAQSEPPQEIEVDPATLGVYVGSYSLAPGFAVAVTVDADQLYVQATGQPRLPVFPSAPNEFFYRVVDAQLSFERAADGTVVAVVLHQNGRNVRGQKR